MFHSIKNINLYTNYSLKTLSTFKIGGNTKYYVECLTTKSLLDVIKMCIKTNLKYRIIGNGSNILFDDMGFNGVIIKYCKRTLSHNHNKIKVASGTMFADLINYAKKHKLSGLESFVGIPCTVGGAIKNNLGAYNSEIAEYILKVTYIKIINKKIKIISNKVTKNDFLYRKCRFFNNNMIFLSCTLNLKPSTCKSIKQSMLYYLNKRLLSQPMNLPNAGSVFKRNNDYIPAKIIDELGLKGLRIGGAEISKKHAGFIVNVDNAKCTDVLTLINHIKQRVKNSHGIDLEQEIEYIEF